MSTTNRPTHRVYAVTRRANDESRWDEIGAVWKHKDGKGFNLKLNYLPLNGGELVIREPKDDSAEGRTAPDTSIDSNKGGV